MSRWFRWYEGTTEDGKFRVVARLSRVTVRDVLALWAFMLEDAAHLDHRGICKRNEDFMASILDFDDGVVERILEALEEVGMISVGHMAITICNWGKRQFEGDLDPTAKERQQRKRERDRQQDNAPVTRDSRPPDTDTDTEKKKDIRAVAKATRPPVDEKFEEFWKSFPRRDGANPKAPAEKLFRGFVKAGTDPNDIIAGARRYAEAERSRIGTTYIAQAVTWLRQRRWQDYAEGADDLPSTVIHLKPDSPQWEEYAARWRASHSGRGPPIDAKGGWTFPAMTEQIQEVA